MELEKVNLKAVQGKIFLVMMVVSPMHTPFKVIKLHPLNIFNTLHIILTYQNYFYLIEYVTHYYYIECYCLEMKEFYGKNLYSSSSSLFFSQIHS